jgi:hypothetical protein
MAGECFRRCVWVEIFGFPPQAWCRKNVELVIANIGKLEWIESDFDLCTSMASVKVLIQTDKMAFIEDHLLFQIEDFQYKIYIRELENNVRFIPCCFCVYQGDAHHGSFKVTKSTEKEEDETVDFCIGSTDDVATGAQRARNNSGFVQEIESAHA